MLEPSELWVSTRKYGVRAGLKTLASTLDQRWVCEELLLIWLYIHCDRDSEKQHKDTTQQELRKHWDQPQSRHPGIMVWGEETLGVAGKEHISVRRGLPGLPPPPAPSSYHLWRALNYSAFQIHCKYISSSNLKQRGEYFVIHELILTVNLHFGYVFSLMSYGNTHFV